MSVFEPVAGIPVTCVRPGCGHDFPAHRAGGGGCPPPCSCTGFRWVTAQGPEHGYLSPPQWPGDDGSSR